MNFRCTTEASPAWQPRVEPEAPGGVRLPPCWRSAQEAGSLAILLGPRDSLYRRDGVIEGRYIRALGFRGPLLLKNTALLIDARRCCFIEGIYKAWLSIPTILY